MSKVKNVLSKVVKPKAPRNPWLDIEHDCDWLSASDGKELVCGLCSARKPA